jgi:hypothetical protein
MAIRNWFYLTKNMLGLTRSTISSPTDTYLNILDGNSPSTGNIISVSDFAATLPAPAPAYKVYTALLTQSGIANPTAIVLENTFGISFSWTRASDGNYQIQDFSNNPFPDNKTFGLCVPSGGSINRILNFTQAFSAIVSLAVLDPLTGSNIDLDGSVVQIEIRVYN